MIYSKPLLIILLFFNTNLGLAQVNSHQTTVQDLHLPDGFKLTIFADNVPNARSLARGDDGVIFVGSASAGNIYALQDADKDGIADKHFTLATGLNRPNGVAYRAGVLYAGEVNRIIRFDNIMQSLSKSPKPVVVFDQLPSDIPHGLKYLRFGPEGKLYSAIGAPCNICKPDKPYASLFRLNTDGSQFEIIASGIRNSVGFDWQPTTETLFFNDIGRDNLGDDLPPEELNRWSKVGDNFGYPYCHAGDISDPEFGHEKKCQAFTPPAWKYKAHVTPLGLQFYRGSQFPAEYKNQLFVAQHGSWNRSQPDGYRIALIRFKEENPISEEIFIDGWLAKNGKQLGRPVDILEQPDGSLLISDDRIGVIYRLEYIGKK